MFPLFLTSFTFLVFDCFISTPTSTSISLITTISPGVEALSSVPLSLIHFLICQIGLDRICCVPIPQPSQLLVEHRLSYAETSLHAAYFSALTIPPFYLLANLTAFLSCICFGVDGEA